MPIPTLQGAPASASRRRTRPATASTVARVVCRAAPAPGPRPGSRPSRLQHDPGDLGAAEIDAEAEPRSAFRGRAHHSAAATLPSVAIGCGACVGDVGADRDRVGHHLVELGDVELTLPAADHHAGDAVADEVGQRAALGHELVDAEHQGHGGDRHRAVRDRRQRRRQGDEARAGDARGALRGQHRDQDDRRVLA